MKATLQAKLVKDIEDYHILAACIPLPAHRAITVDHQIGPPCNITCHLHTLDVSTLPGYRDGHERSCSLRL